MRWISFVLFVCLGSISCDKACPEDINLGNIPLMEPSLKSIPYEEGEIIQFNNSMNDTLVYELSSLGNHETSTFLGELCKSKETNSLLYANSTLYSAKLVLIDLGGIPNLGTVVNFDLGVRLRNLNRNHPLDTLLVDILDICSTTERSFTVGAKTPYNRLEVLINPRNLTDEIINDYDQATYLDEIVLNGQTFLAVYQQGNTSKKIYYNLEQGIIGFEDENGTLWVII